MYQHVIKRAIDVILSLLAIILLAIPMLIIALAIKLDDPGPAIFKQQRVGKNKKLFWLYKFRSMKVDTPDVPTHLLENPDQYISRVGRILRKTSLDELPQIYNIFLSQMSIIGPRPALWNQDDLIAQRDAYGVNDIKPGLTGWAQINGRDELEIADKAMLDGVYASRLNAGAWSGFVMDCRCFVGTLVSVVRSQGVVEGGTGTIAKEKAVEIEEQSTKV